MAQKNYNVLVVSNTTVLSTKGKGDALQAIVEDTGIFDWEGSGTPNGDDIFVAAGGGVWKRKFRPGQPQTIYVDSVAVLKTIAGGSNNQIISTKGYYSAGDGGENMYYWNSSSTATDDGGSVIQVTGTPTGRWIAIFDKNIVNAKQFGAKADGVQDELPFLNAAAAYCGRANRNLTLFLPNGVYRISDQWVIGNKIVPVESELITFPFYSAPSINYGVEVSPNWRPFRIVGSYDSVIHADFSSATLKSAIYYCIRMNTGTTNRDEFGGEISNLKIVGQGSYVGNVEQTFWGWQTPKNQCGIIVLAGLNMTFNNLYFKNMHRGMILNVTYNCAITTWVASYCEYGWRELGSNTGTRNAFHCSNYELAYEVDSTLVTWNGMWAEGPNTVLKVRFANNTTIKGFYNEAHGRALDNQRFVIDIGIDDTEPGYRPEGINGLVFDGIFVPASYTDNSYANGMRLRDSARNVTVIGGNFTSNIQFDSALTTLIFVNSVLRAGTVTGPNRIYSLNAEPSLKSFTTDKEFISLDDLDLKSALTKRIRGLIRTAAGTPGTFFTAFTANQYGLGVGAEISDPNTRFQVNGLQRYNGSRFEGSNNRYVSDWFSINLTGTQDTYYFNIGNYTGASANRLSFDIILDSGYITSSPMSLGRLVKRFNVSFSSNGLSISNQTNEITQDIGTMSSVFSIGNVEAAGSGVLRVPIKILSTVTGSEKRAHVRLDHYIWNGINTQYILNYTPIVSAATTGVFGVKEYMKLPARIDAPGSTSAAGTAPIKIGNGTLMTTPEAGAFESDGSHLFFTVGSNRRRLTPNTTINTITTTGSYTTERVIHFDTIAGNIVFTINPATLFSIMGTDPITLLKVTNDANTVTISPSSGIINGQSSIDLINQYEGVRIYSNNTNLYVV